MYSSNISLKDEGSFSSHDRYYFGPSRLITKQIHVKSNDQTLDFTITGGNNFQPIQVASVVWNSQAYLQGMRPGDQIISVNGISFQQNINYAKALQVCSVFVSFSFRYSQRRRRKRFLMKSLKSLRMGNKYGKRIEY